MPARKACSMKHDGWPYLRFMARVCGGVRRAQRVGRVRQGPRVVVHAVGGARDGTYHMTEHVNSMRTSLPRVVTICTWANFEWPGTT